MFYDFAQLHIQNGRSQEPSRDTKPKISNLGFSNQPITTHTITIW